MSRIVKLPKKVADALTELRVSCGSEGILSGVLGNANTTPFLILKKYIEPPGGFSVLLECLVNGYEVESTPEEIIKNNFISPPPFIENINSYRLGIADTLNTLNIKIEGVNT